MGRARPHGADKHESPESILKSLAHFLNGHAFAPRRCRVASHRVRLILRVPIIRTPARPSAIPDARPIVPGHDITPSPNASPGALRLFLSASVLTLRVSRPIEREAIAYKPARNVFAINREKRYNSPILIIADAFAAYGPARDMIIKYVRGLGPAPILQAIAAATGAGSPA